MSERTLSMEDPPSSPSSLPLLHTPSSWRLLHSHRVLGGDSWEPNHRFYHDVQPVPDITDSEASSQEEGVTGRRGWTVKRQKIRWFGFDWWDISWWISIIFTVGSVFWCINGILFFCYFSRTSPTYLNTEAATAFLGGATFLIGAYLGWVEALNPARDAEFTWAIDELSKTLIEPEHHHNALGRGRHHFGRHLPVPLSNDTKPASSAASTSASPPWKWYGSTKSLAYVANTIQLFGASTFFISVLCGLPGVLPSDGRPSLWIGLYWAMQVLGAPCFVIAGAMFCLETQRKWYIPNLSNIGWQIGFWNMVGGFGFWFCGIFGIWSETSTPDRYQYWGTAFSTFWGSQAWAFLLGSVIQLEESLNKRQ